MSAQFQLKRANHGKQFFNLLASNGEIILTSGMYASKSGAKNGIASVQANSANPDRYRRRKRRGGKSHFVLRAANHQVIGTSETYNANAAMEKGIRSVIKNGKTRKVSDLTA